MASHYYDFLLRILENCKEEEKKVIYLRLYIKNLKAWIISKRNLGSEKSLTAINIFMEIIDKKNEIPEN